LAASATASPATATPANMQWNLLMGSVPPSLADLLTGL
jgi:hypothetical protein